MKTNEKITVDNDGCEVVTIGDEIPVVLPPEFGGNEIIIRQEDLIPSEIIQERQMTEEEFKQNLAVAVKLTSYIGAESQDISSFLNKPFAIKGAIQHACTIRNDDGVLRPETRTVFKLPEGKNISFVSMAATSFFNNCLKPFFGQGDFPFPVTILVTAQKKDTKNTYNFQVVY